MLLNLFYKKINNNLIKVGLHIDYIVKLILINLLKNFFILASINILEYFFFLRVFKYLNILKSFNLFFFLLKDNFYISLYGILFSINILYAFYLI